jgi:hypothetical protein
VIISRIREMIDHGYFTEGIARVLGDETVLEEFFTTGLRMPPHLVLSDILLKSQVQLHQLTPNAIGQLSKYI